VTGARAALALALVVAAGPAHGAGGPLPIVTTTTDLRALVVAVGGDRVAVESLAPPQHDPHAVEVKPGQLARLRGAALLVRVGLDHEPWLGRALATLAEPALAPGGPRDLDLSRSVTLVQVETPRLRDDRATPHLHGFGNPHYWLDPENARPMTAAIAEALGRLAPAERAGFDERRRRFLARLDAGLARWRAALAPFRGARVVAVHDTWPYFAARFGLTIAATVEPTPGVPPSPASLGALVERMRATGVRVLVAEPYASAALVRGIAERSGARAVTLVPSVGADAEAGDYVALFDVDVTRLAGALAAAR
jgi:ABC-type Zn uptake system ZnuABC Zn-binding protein ZnuA